MVKRREPQSSALSFMDCICCGFGAVLLLFILTTKKQIDTQEENIQQANRAAESLQAAIDAAISENNSIEAALAKIDPQLSSRRSSRVRAASARCDARAPSA